MTDKRKYKVSTTPKLNAGAKAITDEHEPPRFRDNNRLDPLRRDVDEASSSQDFREDEIDDRLSPPSNGSIFLPAAMPEIRNVQQHTQPGVIMSPCQFRQENLAASLTDADLLDHIKINFFSPMRRRLKDHLPYLHEARERFGQRGRRVPVPGNPTWTEFCEEQLGMNVRTVQRMLAGDKPKPLTELEAKLLGSAAAAQEAITDLKAGRVEQAIENLQKSTPTLERINEHADRGVASSLANPDGMLVPQIKKPMREPEFDVPEFEPEFGVNPGSEDSPKPDFALPEPRQKEDDAASKVKAALIAEPDRDAASKLLTNYLRSVAATVLGGHVKLENISATVTFGDRECRIMPRDYLLRNAKTGEPALCRCTGTGKYMSRRKIKEFNGNTYPNNKWGSERIVFQNKEKEYSVITEAAARESYPDAFPETERSE